jgi:hypothetical protein
MIVYRAAVRHVDVRAELGAIRAELGDLAPGDPDRHDRVRGIFIAAGGIEAGLVDAACPHEDDASPIERAARQTTIAAARLLRDSWRGVRALNQTVQGMYQCLDRLAAQPLPAQVCVSAAEGYAYYHLYPEAYLEAASAVARELASGSPLSIVGIRGIGTGLGAAAVVEAEAHGLDVASWTVRPRGHPFARDVRLAPALEREWRRRADTTWLVVDEGPGLSGSSLAAVARTLVQIGVPADRVILVPNWAPEPERFSPEIAAVWRRHRVVAAPAERAFDPAARLRERWGAREVIEISGGRWRDELHADHARRALANPLHERRKWLVRRDGDEIVVKFSGLGAFGRAALRRAQAAAEAGFAPAVRDARDGLIGFARLPGRPMRARDALDPALIERLATYLTSTWTVVEEPRTQNPEPRTLNPEPGTHLNSLRLMSTSNLREAYGDDVADAFARRLDAGRDVLIDAPLVHVDGRMMPHEWIAGLAGPPLKTDGIDHGDDHFFPGPSDPAWDVAGTIVEWRLRAAAADALTARVAAATRDRTLARRVATYSVFYLAFRLGYASLSADALGDTPDGRRWRLTKNRSGGFLRKT